MLHPFVAARGYRLIITLRMLQVLREESIRKPSLELVLTPVEGAGALRSRRAC